MARLFDWEITKEGLFLYHYDEAALDYEERLFAGRYVLGTSLTPAQATGAEVLRAYRRPLEVESSFRVLKSVLELRPVFTGPRTACGPTSPSVCWPRSSKPSLRPTCARRHGRSRQATIVAGERHIHVVTRRNALQARVLTAFGVDTSGWDRARIG